MIIYVYGKCSTCKEAIKFLENSKVKYTKKEITETPPTLKELESMLEYYKGDLKKLFNTSGNLYKEMKLSEKLNQMSQKEALTLLTQHGMLVKRPFLLAKDFGLTGFKETEWIAYLK